MSLPTESRAWVLANPAEGDVVLGSGSDKDTWKVETLKLDELTDGLVLVKVLSLSNDPAQRGWIDKNIDPKRLYVPPVKKGDVMRARAIVRVLASKSAKYKEGDHAMVSAGWREYYVAKESELQPTHNIPGVPLTTFLGPLGTNGLTAYAGLLEVVKTTKKDDTVVVSGAAGATGQIVVQIAKNVLGCKNVVGIAGGKEKCDLVKSLGADICVDYKSANFKQDLVNATPDLTNVYFDNVGGETLDLMLTRMAKYGRVCACGSISTYNATEKGGLKNYFEVISMELEIKGFIVMSFLKDAQKFIGEIVQWVKEGKIKLDHSETVVETSFEKIPETWTGLFEGKNVGKLVTTISK